MDPETSPTTQIYFGSRVRSFLVDEFGRDGTSPVSSDGLFRILLVTGDDFFSLRFQSNLTGTGINCFSWWLDSVEFFWSPITCIGS